MPLVEAWLVDRHGVANHGSTQACPGERCLITLGTKHLWTFADRLLRWNTFAEPQGNKFWIR